MALPATNSELEALLKAVGDDLIRAYRDKYFPAKIIQACPNLYSVENAPAWVNLDRFSVFVAHAFQQQSPPPSPPRPAHHPGGALKSTRTSSTSLERRGSFGHPACGQTSLSGDSFDTGESENDVGAQGHSVPQKRKREDQISRAPKQSPKLAAGLIRVTRQSWVKWVETMTETPEEWRVPESDEPVAYVLDLTEDPHEYKDAKGKALAMSAIIKHKCTDGWAGGSGGSVSKATTVTILGDQVKCQKLSHECRGAFICSMSEPGLWDGYKRHDRSVETSPLSSSPPQDLNEHERNSRVEQTVVFYNNTVKDKCPFDSIRCPGRPALKQYEQPSAEGAFLFVGCSAAASERERSHFFREVPIHVDNVLLQQLFNTGRVNFSDTVVFDRPCMFSVPPRTGLKQKQCPHVHYHDGQIVEGTILQRPCPAKITIFSPVDHTLRKAAVIPSPGVPHNHPFHPWGKVTRRAKAAARAAGVMDTAAGDIDRTSTTPSIVDGFSSSHMVLSGSSIPPVTPGSSISFMAPSYRIEQCY